MAASTSPAGSLNKTDLKKIAIGALLAAVSGALVYLGAEVDTLADYFGEHTLLGAGLVTFAPVLVNFARKWVSDHQG